MSDTTITISLTLRMLSDWHIGTGTAAHGHISRRVLRDEHGLPYVPAKTLNGVWRDACEVAAHALDSGGEGVWHDWVDFLFGSQPAFPGEEAARETVTVARHPRPAALRLRGPLRLPGRLGPALAGRRELRDAVTFVRPGVAIDPGTGTAAEDQLRFDEMARGGLSLAGEAELDVGADEGADEGMDEARLGCALALLWAGAALVEGIGAKRRRGAGRCRLEPAGPGMPPGPERLRALVNAPVPPPPPDEQKTGDPGESAESGNPGESGERAPVAAARDEESGWERALLRMELVIPLIAHDRTIGNAVQTRDHAPGWMLLPQVLKKLGSRAAAEAARRGDLVVTPATPVIHGAPGSPAPRVLAQGKDDPELFVNRMAGSPPDPGQVLKRLKSGYLPPASEGRLILRRPRTVLRMHNTIADVSQRPSARLGGVYVYRALAAGTVLAAEVRVRSGLLEEGWHERLSGDWRLGRSRKDDYGLVKVTVSRDVPAGPSHAGLGVGDRLRVWLLSDTLVRDARLAPSTDPADLAGALQDTFAAAGASGVVLRQVDDDDGLIHASFETARTDSWHTGWRLPRPALLGFAAGGCMEFTVVAGRIGADALAAAELAGVGERRGEGFGRIRLNDPLLAETVPDILPESANSPEPANVPEPAGSRPHDAAPDPHGETGLPEGAPPGPGDAGWLGFVVGAPEHASARIVEKAAWRTEIWRRSEALAGDRGDRVLGDLAGLTSTQLNSIRTLFDHLDEPEKALAVRIDRLTRRWNRQSGASRALKELLVTKGPWKPLGLPLPEGRLVLTRDGPQRLRHDLRGEALRSLLTACLAAETRRRSHSGSPQGEER